MERHLSHFISHCLQLASSIMSPEVAETKNTMRKEESLHLLANVEITEVEV